MDWLHKTRELAKAQRVQLSEAEARKFAPQLEEIGRIIKQLK